MKILIVSIILAAFPSALFGQTADTVRTRKYTRDEITDFESAYQASLVRKAHAKKNVTNAVTTSRLALSTNIGDLAWCLTPNIGLQFALGQHWTLTADVKYNRWAFNDDSVDNRIRQARQEYALGFRWWYWYTYSGWWLGLKAQYREYSGNGILGHNFGTWGDRYIKEEGDAVGGALSFGYSIQITRWLDIDLGLGIWGGYVWYKQYSGEYNGQVCPRYGKRIDAKIWEPASREWFWGPNEAIVSFIFIF